MTPDEQQPGAENGGRLRDHDVSAQLTAADAVLIALGRSSSDAGAVLATVAEAARRLCRCQGVQIYLLHGEEFEMAATVDYLFGFDATARVVGDHQYAMVADAYVLDDATRSFVGEHNPRALHDMLSRLLEAMQRGLWQSPGDYKDQLENLLLGHEQQMEGLSR